MKTHQLYWLFALTTTASAAFAPDPLRAADSEVRVEHDIAYLGEGRQEKLDLYLPAKVNKGQRLPGVVIIHGGGFTGGTKRGAREQNIGTTLAKHGYVCISIDYLLAATDKPAWPQNLHDCKTAVRWLRANADKYHIDPDHIGVIGGSAGGHLALMVGLTDPDSGLDPKEPYGKFSCRVQAVVDLYGPGDLVSRGKDHVMFPGTLADKPEMYRQASPVTHASKGDPPVLILHGTGDKTVPVEQSKLMAEALKKAGVEHELILVEGAPHSFHLEPREKDLRPVVIGFFDKHLKSK
jgi:acetyl esterase/lipase